MEDDVDEDNEDEDEDEDEGHRDDEENDDQRSNPSSDANLAGEDVVSADVGSTGELDQLKDGVGPDTGGPLTQAFFGASSPIAWIRRVREQLDARSIAPMPGRPLVTAADAIVRNPVWGPPARPLPLSPEPGVGVYPANVDVNVNINVKPDDFAYDAGPLQLPALGPLEELVLPPKPVADLLMDAYLATMHPSFPLLWTSRFMPMYEACYDFYGPPSTGRRRAILNVVFALGAVYSSLARAGWCDEHDHRRFFARATTLGLEDSVFWITTDLEQVQLAGLASLYLIAAGQVNR